MLHVIIRGPDGTVKTPSLDVPAEKTLEVELRACACGCGRVFVARRPEDRFWHRACRFEWHNERRRQLTRKARGAAS